MPSGFSFRFSVLSLLLLVTLAGVTTSHVLTSKRNVALATRIREQQKLIRQQNDQLRQLTVDDPQQVHIISKSDIWPSDKLFLNGRPPEMLQWELHFPPKSRWKIFWATAKIPQTGLPSQRLGGHLLSVPTDHHSYASVDLHEAYLFIWKMRIGFEAEGWAAELTNEEAAWLQEKAAISWEAIGGDQHHKPFTESFAPDKTIVLLRIRRMIDTGPSTVQDDLNPCEGFMVWLEPQFDRR